MQLFIWFEFNLYPDHMLDKNLTVDDDIQSFEISRENNHGVTETSSWVVLGFN